MRKRAVDAAVALTEVGEMEETLGKGAAGKKKSDSSSDSSSSAEGEFYVLIEAVTRANGLLSLALEMGFRDL